MMLVYKTFHMFHKIMLVKKPTHFNRLIISYPSYEYMHQIMAAVLIWAELSNLWT